MNKVDINIKEMDYEIEEELKTLRTNLMFCGVDKKVILVTSTVPGEGKTETSVRLAYSLAKLNKNVLLVDLDLRKSVMVSRYDMGKMGKGMSHFLSGQCALGDVIYSTNIPKMHIAVAGPSVPNATELLSGERMHKLLDSVREVYDYIIVDSAPLGLVIDAAIVAKECDGTILVVEAGTAKYRQVQEVKNRIESSGCKLLGVVLNKVDVNGRGYKNEHYGRYGQYGGYYGEKKSEK